MDGNFITYSAAYDQQVNGVGGVALAAMRDQNGEGSLATTTISGIYAYTANLSRKASIKAGFQASFFQHSIQWEKLQFADMIDSRQGFVHETNESAPTSLGANADISAGAVFYSSRYFGGVSVHHLTQPVQPMFGYEARLQRKYTVHGGAKFQLNKGFGDIEISPNLLIQRQGNFTQVNAGLYVKKDPVIAGLWYRHKDAVIVLFGLDFDKTRIGYSFDYTTSRLGVGGPGGSHELSFVYKLNCKPRKKNYRVAECPVF